MRSGNMENKVRVSDVYLNAYLRSGGYSSIDYEVARVDGRRTVTFIYEDTDGSMDKAIGQFRDSQFMRDFIREYLYTKRAITKALTE